jgi:hypothetical protein
MVGIKPTTFGILAWCEYTLRVTSQASYSPEYITPTQKKSILNVLSNETIKFLVAIAL